MPDATQRTEIADTGCRSRHAWRTASAEASEVALTLARSAADAVVAANKSVRTLVIETRARCRG